MIARKLSFAVALAAILAVGFTTPAQAEDPTPPVPESELTLEQLREFGVVGDPGDPVDTQTDEYGNTMHVYEDGQFLVLPDQTTAARAAAVWVTGCAGNFTGISKLSGELYWGAQNNCATSSPSGVYPHIISSTLRSTCTGPFGCGLFFDVRSARTPVSQEFNKVTTLSVFTPCVTSTTRHYQQVVRIQVGGFSAGPFVSPTNLSVPCNVNPD